MDKEKKKVSETDKTNEDVTFTSIKSPTRNIISEANDFLIAKEKEGARISDSIRNQFIVIYTKKENLEEAWRELNGD